MWQRIRSTFFHPLFHLDSKIHLRQYPYLPRRHPPISVGAHLRGACPAPKSVPRTNYFPTVTLFRRPVFTLFFITTLLVCTGFLAITYLAVFLTTIALVTGTIDVDSDCQNRIPGGGFQYAELMSDITAMIEGSVERIDKLLEKQEFMEERIRGFIREVEVIKSNGGTLQNVLPDNEVAVFTNPPPGSTIHTAVTQSLDTLLEKLRKSAENPGFRSNLLEARTELQAIIGRLDTLTQAINRTGKTGDEIMRYQPDMVEVLKEWKERNEKAMDGFERLIMISEASLDVEVERLDMLRTLLDAWKKLH